MYKPLFVIYHGGCMDGLGAALAIKVNADHPDTVYYPGAYDKDPPYEALADKHVYLVDFSYSRDQLMKMAEMARTITILDHHKTALEDLRLFLARDEVMAWPVEEFQKEAEAWKRARQLTHRGPFIRAKFDMAKSGAVLAWEHFSSQPLPLFYQYLQDRDLWTKKFHDCDEVSWGLRSFNTDLNVWLDYFAPYLEGPEGFQGHVIDKLSTDGEAIKRFLDLEIQKMVPSAHPFTILKAGQAHTSVACNAPPFMVSDLAGELAKTTPCGWAACYSLTKSGMVVSLRSARGEDGKPRFDVGELAKGFSCNGRGGGHAAASGFEITNPTRTIFSLHGEAVHLTIDS